MSQYVEILPHEYQVLRAMVRAENKADATEGVAQANPNDEVAFQRAEYRRSELKVARDRVMRVLKGNAWNEAHDLFCPVEARDCEVHVNPYVRERRRG